MSNSIQLYINWNNTSLHGILKFTFNNSYKYMLPNFSSVQFIRGFYAFWKQFLKTKNLVFFSMYLKIHLLYLNTISTVCFDLFPGQVEKVSEE